MDVDWTRRPTLLEYWPDDIDVIMGLDENGISNLRGVRKSIKNGNSVPEHDKYFTLTGVALNKSGYSYLKDKMNSIKYSYWNEGVCEYNGEIKRVCFHSREIRKNQYPFDNIEHSSFKEDIANMIRDIPSRVISCTIDKELLCNKYVNAFHPYHLAIEFILERLCNRLNHTNQYGVIMLESRGYKEDKFVLKHIVEVIENGSSKNPPSHFRNLKGAYFNPKWWKGVENKASFVILELADLISYPIYKFVKNGTEDRAFKIIKSKLLRNPVIEGWGLKIFP